MIVLFFNFVVLKLSKFSEPSNQATLFPWKLWNFNSFRSYRVENFKLSELSGANFRKTDSDSREISAAVELKD